MTPLRHAVRSLGRARGFTAATIVTMALAVGAGSAVVALMNAVVLRPLPYPDSDRLVGLWLGFPAMNMPAVRQSPGTYQSFRQSATLFESIGTYGGSSATIVYGDPTLKPERIRAASASAEVFSMLRARPIVGRVLTDADEARGAPRVALISERLWRTRFGADPAILGRMLELDRDKYAVVGVLPAPFAYPEPDVAVWVPGDIRAGQYLGFFAFNAIGRLKPGVSIDAAQRELQQILMRTPETFPEQRPGVSTAKLLAQGDARVVVHRLRDDVVGDFDRLLWLVGGTVALLALVALSNVASLLLVRLEARQRELAVRMALGSSAGRLLGDVAIETAVVSVAGGALGAALAIAALRILVTLGPADVPRLHEVRIDAVLWSAAIGLSMTFVLVTIAIGAWRVHSLNTLSALRDGGRSATQGRSAQRLRATFVAVEVALSLVLLSGSAVLGRSVLRLRAVEPGFNPSNTLTFWTSLPQTDYPTPDAIARFYTSAITRLEQIPGVVSAGAVSKLPLEIEASYGKPIWVEDAPPAAGIIPPVFRIASATSGYFRAMEIPLLAGRTFDAANVNRGQHEAVVSRGLARRYWSDSTGRRAIGRRLRMDAAGPFYTIVGVVGDVRDSLLTLAPMSAVYVSNDALPSDVPSSFPTMSAMAFVVRTRTPQPTLASSMQQAIQANDPNLAIYRVATLDQLVDDASARMTFALLLLGIGAAATLVLGVVGLYGVIAFVVALRSREIGIRIALGLEPPRATRLVLREGQRIVAIGAVVGLGVFLLFAKLLQALAFEVDVADRWAMTAATVVVMIVATTATWVPARRAGRIDPMEALRIE